MIVGGYSLHLYCDGQPCARGRDTAPQNEFDGPTAGECKRQARAAGWRFVDRRKCYCTPDCAL